MRVLTVAPLVRGIPYEELTYFAKDDVSAGDLVEVTIKKRVCRALVLTAVDAEEERQSLRHASFVMKKITKVITKHFIPEELWNALFYASTYLIRPVGALIYDLLSEKAYDEIVPFVNQEVSQGFDLW